MEDNLKKGKPKVVIKLMQQKNGVEIKERIVKEETNMEKLQE